MVFTSRDILEYSQLDPTTQWSDDVFQKCCGVCWWTDWSLTNLIGGLEYPLSNPWKRTQNGDEDKDIGNDTSSNYSSVLSGVMPYNINNFKQQPANEFISFAEFWYTKISYAAPESAQPEWIPPTCCRIETTASFIGIGAHYRSHCQRLSSIWYRVPTLRNP